MPVEIATVYVVTSDASPGHTWRPSIKRIKGEVFCELNKWCRELTRFCTGKSMDLRRDRSHTINCKYFDHLLQERNRKSVEAARLALEAENERKEEEPQPKKQRKPRAIRQTDEVIAPDTVSITLPGVEWADMSFEERDVKVAWSVGGSSLFIEMSVDVLEQVRCGILSSLEKGEEGKMKRNKILPLTAVENTREQPGKSV